MNLKKLALIFSFVLSSFFLGSAFADFADVPEESRYADAIAYVEKEGVVSGYADGTFQSDRSINRAEFIKVVGGAKFDPVTIETCIANNIEDQSQSVFFPDVLKNDWFAKYVCIARKENLISGYADGTFHPEATITFVEAAKILVNAFGLIVSADQEIWYRPFVQKMAEQKAIPREIAGFSTLITRGMMADMIYRLDAKVTTKLSATYETLAGEVAPPEEISACDLTPETGSCKAALPRYFFNSATGACAEFSWGGCDGVVPFETLEECQASCSSALKILNVAIKEFTISAKMWEFAPTTLTVKKDDRVRLLITSLDVEHGFALPAFDINEPLPPAQTVEIEFVANQSGIFPFFSSVFSGVGYGNMKGTFIVEE